MRLSFEHELARHKVEQTEHWNGISHEFPYLQFQPAWKVRIIPPFGGAVARFTVRTDKMPPDTCISVYLDYYDRLGCMGKPYWEIYPDADSDDTARFLLDETDDLLAAIAESIKCAEANQ